ncbi:MAG: hypothetical protein SV186_02460 [Candidatus Nanohaloarchaea archaeon]|nr:hypothetical protein [Candidatus Nanohaloarchaea archaeon]
MDVPEDLFTLVGEDVVAKGMIFGIETLNDVAFTELFKSSTGIR